MKFSCSFSSITRETIVNMLHALGKLNDVTLCLVVLKDNDGLEVRAVTDASSAFGKIASPQFSSFNVISKMNNTIAVEVNIGTLLSAFKNPPPTTPAESCLKLTKTVQDVVCFTLVTTTFSLNSVITQHVPILRLLPAQEMVRYREPDVGEAQVTLAFPDAKLAKSVLDRMKNLSKRVHIKADQHSGKLVFRVDTEIVSTRTVFDGLSLESVTGFNGGQHQFVVAQLNSKEFLAVTSAIAAVSKRTSNTVLAIVKNCAVCVHVSFDDESHLTYYLAANALEGSDEEEENTDDDVLHNTRSLLRMETQQE